MTHVFLSQFELKENEDTFIFRGAHVYYNKKTALLVSPEHGSTLLIDKELLSKLKSQDISSGLKLKLVQRGLATYRNSRSVNYSAEKACPVFFMIDLTKRCCLGCRYCFRDLEDKSVIDDKVLGDICAFIEKHCREFKLNRINIQAWGGEPLMAMSKIRFIYNYFKNTDISVEICIETNGAVVTDAIAAELKAMQVRVGVSIDGTPELHNQHRPFLDGSGSIERVLRGLKSLHDAGFHHNHQGISVVTKRSWNSVEKIVDYFCNELDLNLFKFGLIKPNPQMKELGLELSNDEVEDFAARMFDAIIQKLREGKRVVESGIRTRVNNLTLRKPFDICFSRGCMGGKKMVAFDQKGNIFTCELMDMRDEAFGSIYEGFSLRELIERALKSHPFYTPKSSERCHNCPWHCFCRGGCTSAIRYKDGAYTGHIDEVTCAMNRVLYEKIANLLLEEPELLPKLLCNDDTIDIVSA